MQMDNITYFPLSMIAGKNGYYKHAVYITGRHCLFHHNNGEMIERIVRKAAGWLEYITYGGNRYYVDDACTLR